MSSLLDIIVLPLNPTVINGQTTQLQAIGVYDDDTQADLTTTVDWTSGTPGHATVGLNTGLVTGVATGTSLITATSGAIVGSQTVTSGVGALVSIDVTSASQSDILGGTEQYTATGTYEDTSTADLTTSVDWTSSVPGVATVGLHTGLVTSVAVGATVVTATLGLVSDTLGYAVHNDLVSIAITPLAPSKAKGLTQQFTATGTYEDASEVNITTSVSWGSSSANVTVPLHTGLATAASAGTATISAVLGAISAPTTVMTVTAAELVSIAVTPASPTVINGQTVQMAAVGTYTDASTVVLTTTADWASDSAHATVGLHTGLVTGVSDGTAVVGATVGAVEGHTTVTSTKGNIVGIVVTPTALVLPVNSTQQMVATATYQDSSTANVASTATWAASNVCATVSATGLVTIVSGGNPAEVTISATLGVTGSVAIACVAQRDGYHNVDVSSLTSLTAVQFGYVPDSQALVNHATYDVEYSWDGVNKAVLGAVGTSTSAIGFQDHDRSVVYLMRKTGTGGGPTYVEIYTSAR